MAEIEYRVNHPLSIGEFIDVLNRSGLGERRPVGDEKRISEMLAGANLLVTAYDGDKPVGVARALSDYSYCTYLSDLAVDVAYQKKGIGRKLIESVRQVGGSRCSLILLSAPAAMDYYPKIGMPKADNCFILARDK